MPDAGETGEIRDVLKDVHTLFQDLAERSLVGVYLIQDGVFRYVNPKLAEIFGYPRDELIGKMGPKDLVHPEDWPLVDERLRKRLAGEEEYYHYDFRGVTRENKTIYIEVYGSRTEYQGAPAVIGSLLDITARKKAEKDLKRYAVELEESNRMKDLFTDIMGHDFLNPLSSVKISSQILLDDETDPERREILEIIEKNCVKMEEMIDSASLFSRLQNQKGEGTRQLLDLASLLSSALEGFEKQLEENTMEVNFQPDGEYPLKANPLIGNLFENLISNAIKYSPGGSNIDLNIEDREDGWLVSVADQGNGVPDEYKEAIFAKFERGEKRGMRGTGMGLAIARRIVEGHGGRIWVEDNSEGGSVFYVKLPKGL